MNLNNKKILVTGGNGFLGSHVINELKKRGVKNEDITIPRSKKCDLRIKKNVTSAVKDKDIVIHLAAVCGGIGANMKSPGSFYYDNALMGLQMIHESWKAGVEKFVAIGTICAYPRNTPIPFKEENLWNGYPEETNAPYGLAKKMMLVQCQSYRQQYGFNCIYLLPVNLYGIGDSFDLNNSHVIPALILKCLNAIKNNKKEIVCWGDGSPTREFLYVEDAANGIVLATEKYNKQEPVNIGAGFEISIKELTEQIAELTGFKGNIIWDISKPNGQPRRCLDTNRAEREFGFKAETSFRDGLKKTIDWYKLKIKYDKCTLVERMY